MYAIHIPQESVTIPETIDGIRAACSMQLTREEGTAMTNKYLRIGQFKGLFQPKAPVSARTVG